MANFRRVIMALAVLALFTGLASAQVVIGSQQLTCATNVGVTPAMRAEGFTEMTGDVQILCTGGVTPVVGQPVGLVNFTVFYNSTVTSRLIGSGGLSEALLLIDEPGSGLTGAGPLRPQVLCTTPTTGCAATVGTVGTDFVAVNPGTATPAPNVYQGIVSGNSVTFLGVPVLAPTSTASRVFRITNVRVNGTTSPSQVQASISITPASALAITQPVTNVGFVNPSLTVSATKISTLNQCESKIRIAASTLTFTEKFASAFKTRIYAQTDTAYAGQTGLSIPGAAYGTTTLATSQSVPGSVTNSNSESNFVFPIAITGGTAYAGLADFGTRLKATFTNIPSGVRIYVSQANVTNAAAAAAVPGIIGGSAANTVGTYVPYARLVTSDSVVDNQSNTVGTVLSALDTTSTVGTPGDVTTGVQATEVLVANGTGTATWEILNTSPTTVDTYKFGVYISYTSNITNNFPPPGDSVSVNLTYAPTATSGVPTTGPIPRFASDANATTLLNIGICKTILLYPFVTNQAGFDTGFAIANTTQDPFGIAGQKGTCRLNWYGDPKTVPFSDWPSLDAGTVHADVLSVMNPGFQGYAIAVCNFQYAHGYASIFNNFGAANGVFSSYLAVVLNDPRTGNTLTTTNENGAH